MKVKIADYPERTNKKRKVKVKIHNFDVFSLDETLALIILPALKKYKKIRHGAPVVDNCDVPEELWSENEDLTDIDDNWFKRWDYVLDCMIWSFSEKLREWESDYFWGEHDFKSIPVDKNGNECLEKDCISYKMIHGPNHTFEMDMEGIKKHEQRIQKGFDLFGKYYQGLWS